MELPSPSQKAKRKNSPAENSKAGSPTRSEVILSGRRLAAGGTDM